MTTTYTLKSENPYEGYVDAVRSCLYDRERFIKRPAAPHVRETAELLKEEVRKYGFPMPDDIKDRLDELPSPTTVISWGWH